jgi:hypothetical protein
VMRGSMTPALRCAMAAAVVLTASGCGGASMQRQGGPFAGDAANAAYVIEGKEIRLAGGRAASGEGGAASETQLTDGKLEGDLNGDDITDLLVVVAHDQAGEGAAFYLAAMVSEGKTYRSVPAAKLGDKLVVKNIRFDGPDIKLRLVVRDPENADPRPSKVIERRYRFQKGMLVGVLDAE